MRYWLQRSGTRQTHKRTTFWNAAALSQQTPNANANKAAVKTAHKAMVAIQRKACIAGTHSGHTNKPPRGANSNILTLRARACKLKHVFRTKMLTRCGECLRACQKTNCLLLYPPLPELRSQKRYPESFFHYVKNYSHNH